MVQSSAAGVVLGRIVAQELDDDQHFGKDQIRAGLAAS
jgi:hypothetical protein